MLLVQSRSQNLFNRIYTTFCRLFVYMLVTLIFAMFGRKIVSDFSNLFFWAIGFVCVVTLWLTIFNSGEGKIIEYGLELDDRGITYITFGSRNTIRWADFDKLVVKNGYPRTMLLKRRNGPGIEIDFYAFSSKQRSALFEYLESR